MPTKKKSQKGAQAQKEEQGPSTDSQQESKPKKEEEDEGVSFGTKDRTKKLQGLATLSLDKGRIVNPEEQAHAFWDNQPVPKISTEYKARLLTEPCRGGNKRRRERTY